jgi:hypothetical protein
MAALIAAVLIVLLAISAVPTVMKKSDKPISSKISDRLRPSDPLSDYRERLLTAGKTKLEAETCTHDALVDSLHVAKQDTAQTWEQHLSAQMLRHCALIW